jgi:hypothetical protein
MTKSNSSSSRRIFLMQTISVGGGLLAASSVARAQGAMVAETDPQAVALSYKADATKTDKTKNPRYAAGQNCANCALYQAPATAAAGGCPLFAGKQVAAKGWCSAWAKKA